jgi:3-hydroxyisobutyrate dehydrogenase-like beta-hydroxyacid dehydrogenase
MNKPTIGFIGVGRMGGPMAARLVKAGYDVTVLDMSAEAMAPLVAAGAKQGANAKAVAGACDIVIASLPTPPIVEKVAAEVAEGGKAAGGKATIFIDMSTTGATYAKRIAASLAEKGITQVDAPISGGIKGAVNGTLAVMVSCDEATFATVEPVLKNTGKIFYVGKLPGQGQTMKLVNNLLSASAMAASSEAIVMAVKAGIDAQMAVDVMNAGTAKNSATEDKLPRFVLPRTFNLGFAMSLLNKDIRLCMEEAEAMGIPMIVGSAVKQLLAITNAEMGAAGDMTDTVRIVERWAGVEVGKKA